MVPLIITMDLEIAFDHDFNEQEKILEKLCTDLNILKLPITIFSTAETHEYFPKQIKMLHSLENEIACHGLNHSKAENYRNMPAEEIKEKILKATKRIEETIKERPVSFRGPGMSTSAITQKILVDNGYKNDFSVCPQRLDFFYSKGGSIEWLFSPRKPYHPSEKSPYQKGNMPITVIPLSTVGIPFTSGVLYLFGLGFMKILFNILVNEALKKNKPIVYLFHSYEFTPYIGISGKIAGVDKDKRKLIHRFYKGTPASKYDLNINLFKHMLAADMIFPLTGKNYINSIPGKR
jgi:hypothetical protein